MAETRPEEPVEHSGGAYEHTDARIRFVIYFVVGLTILGIATELLLGWGYSLLDSMRGPAVVSPMSPPRELPPQPRLQVSPARDMAAYLVEEEKQLAGKGTTERIQIDRAKEMVLQSGFTSRPPEPEGSSAPIPLESGGLSSALATGVSPADPAHLAPAYLGGEKPPPAAAKPDSGEFGAPPVPSKRLGQGRPGGAHDAAPNR